MMAKNVEANKYWHSDEYIQKIYNSEKDFDYSEIDSIKRFQGSHPVVMHERIHYINWTFDRDPKVKNFTLKKRILYLIEKYTGWRVGEYKNYKIIYLAKVEGLDYY